MITLAQMIRYLSINRAQFLLLFKRFRGRSRADKAIPLRLSAVDINRILVFVVRRRRWPTGHLFCLADRERW